MYTQWKDKRDVAILATNCTPGEPPVQIERRGKGGAVSQISKPKAVVMYNNNMGGVDRSDQMRAYYLPGGASHK